MPTQILYWTRCGTELLIDHLVELEILIFRWRWSLIKGVFPFHHEKNLFSLIFHKFIKRITYLFKNIWKIGQVLINRRKSPTPFSIHPKCSFWLFLRQFPSFQCWEYFYLKNGYVENDSIKRIRPCWTCLATLLFS